MGETIRWATGKDAEAIAAIYAPFVRETAVSFETEVPSVEEMARRIEATSEIYPWLVVEAAGEVLGYAYASAHRARAAYVWSVDVTIYLHPSARGRGLGKRLYKTLFRVLRVQGFVAAHAGIALPNPASVGIHERLGFVQVGVYRDVGYKSGAWHDVGWWRLTLQAPVENPPAPTPVGELSDRDAILIG